MTTPRNLVLLLTSGHTVRIALRDDDLPADDTNIYNAQDLSDFLCNMPANIVVPTDCVADGSEPDGPGHVVMAYVEDLSLPSMLNTGGIAPPNDFQRISVEGPGTVVQYG